MNYIKRKSSSYIISIMILLVIGTAGYIVCSIAANGNKTIGKIENGYRVDKEPITNRFPKLGQFVKCYWKAGIVGRNSVGPSSYWMKGFVVLKSQDFEALKTQYKWMDAENGWKPSLDEGILNVHSFRWSYNAEFNKYIKSANYVGKFYLDLEHGIVFFDVQK